ncbi:MAG: photosynthetic reaction center cytochrome c subunit [Chitinophagaceae bacterium]|nr:photosynthetic reaction center cytochrome c subunit [Rubrivivax sp.]
MTLLSLGGVIGVIGLGLLFTFESLPVQSVQTNYRGTGSATVLNPRTQAAQYAANMAPAAPEPADPTGERASEIYENVPALGHLSVEQFGRIMNVMTAWIYPGEGENLGCNGCHVPGNFAAEDVYQKHVARRMIQMTMALNSEWTSHTQDAGVTCWTCHRGNAVPLNVWSEMPRSRTVSFLAGPGEQNRPAPMAGYASLPTDAMTSMLYGDNEIRVAGNNQHPSPDSRVSIQQTEWTFSLMIHMSSSLGVNCSYCHNSRNWADWEQSPPQRLTAWYGIRMVRDINNTYIDTVRDIQPDHRLGPLGDTLKVNCTTCHQGQNLPVNNARWLQDYPELVPPAAYDTRTVVPPPAELIRTSQPAAPGQRAEVRGPRAN